MGEVSEYLHLWWEDNVHIILPRNGISCFHESILVVIKAYATTAGTPKHTNKVDPHRLDYPMHSCIPSPS